MRGNSSGKLTAVFVAVLVTASIVTGGMAVMAQDHTGNDTSVETDDPQQTSYLRVVHASPDAPDVNVTLSEVETETGDEVNETTTNETITNETTTNETTTNETDTDGVENVTDTDDMETVTDVNETVLDGLSFGEASEYHQLSAGEYTVTVTAAGDNASAADNESVVFEGTVTLEPRTAQTLTVSEDMIEDSTLANETDGEPLANETEEEPLDTDNETEEDSFDMDNGTDVEDDSSESLYVDNALGPMGDNATVRVLHLSPDAPAVDVVTENGTVLAENVSFRNNSDYVTVPAGNYTVEIWESAPMDDNMTEMPGENETEDDTATDLEEEANGTQNDSSEVLATAVVSPESGNAYSVVAAGLTAPAEDANETEIDDGNETEMSGENETEDTNETALGEDNVTDLEETEMASGIFVIEDPTTSISLPGADDMMDGENETENETDTGTDLDDNMTEDDNETENGLDDNETVADNETEDNTTDLGELTDTDSDLIVIEDATILISSSNVDDLIIDRAENSAGNETAAAT